MGGVCCNSKANEVRRTHKSNFHDPSRRVNTEPIEEYQQRLTTNNIMSEENIYTEAAKKDVKIINQELSEEKDCVEFDSNEEAKGPISRRSKSINRRMSSHRSSKYISKDLDSVIDESSVIKSKNRFKNNNDSNINNLKLDGLQQLDQSESYKSILNFNPDDMVGKKGNTYRTKRSGATSGTILKTPHGFEAINTNLPLQYLSSNKRARIKNKRQFSENDNLVRYSQELVKIMHKHHVSLDDTKLAGLSANQIKKLKEVQELRQISNFMDEPRELLSILSNAQREMNMDENKPQHSIQLSTLSTNPRKRERSRKHNYDSAQNFDDLGPEHRNALIEDQSMLYDDEVMMDDPSGGSGPNEAMYVNIDPIPSNLMLSFEEALQRQKEILDKSSKVNRYNTPVWDSRKHTKHKYYKKDQVDESENDKIFKRLKISDEYTFQKMDEIIESPCIIDI